MSTALYLWSSSSNGDEDQEKKLPLEAHEQLNVEPAKPARSKRAVKSQVALPKKQPQRGLGIAQLEKLRTQESKFIETDRSLPPSLVPAALDLSQNHHFPFAFPVVDPETGMSMARFAPVSYYDAFAEAQIRSQQLALQRYRIANGGGMPLADSRWIFPDPTQLDRCRIPVPEMRFQGRSGFPYGGATSVEDMMVARELSSSQKSQCLSNHCEVCAKDCGNGSSGGGFMDVATNGGDFLGLNIGSGFGERAEWRGGSSGMHVDQTIFRNPNKIKPYVVPNPERCNVPAAAIFASSDSVIIVDVNAPDAHVALHKWKPNTPDSHGTPFLFQHGKATHGSAGGALMRMLKGPAGDWQFPQALAFPTSGIRSSAVVAATCDKEIITGGHADNSVKLISSDGAITIETAARHCAPVTCLALSPDSNHLVTGSQDTTLILWRIHRAPLSQLSNISKSSTSAATTACTNSPHSGRDLSNIVDTSRRSRIEGPLQVLRGHLKAIVCCGVDSDMGIVVSCSQSSGVLLHSIRGRLIRKLEAVEADAIYHTLKLKDGQDITSVALNKDNTNLLVSTADKQLIIFTDPDLSLNAGQMLPSNLEGNNLTPHSK